MDNKEEDSPQEPPAQKREERSEEELQVIDEHRFNRKLDQLIEESEEMRLNRMQQHRTRGFMSMSFSILFVLIGVGLFGWFFLVEVDLLMAFVSIILSTLPPVFLSSWAAKPLKTYASEHKKVFMPKLAHALNGLKFHPDRGVGSKILEHLVVLPPYKIYEAEDCFMGTYKGVKVLFSEARLYTYNKRNGPDFDGIFVLLEIPGEAIDGHTIITADHKMVKNYAKTRWKKLKKAYISVDNPEWDKFVVYSTKPESAELLVGERLLKELAEASEIFDNAPLTAVLFGKKYVFMMIPYDEDMFEPSNMFVPITTKQHAMQCKKEIEQILEIIDVFDLYKPADK